MVHHTALGGGNSPGGGVVAGGPGPLGFHLPLPLRMTAAESNTTTSPTTSSSSTGTTGRTNPATSPSAEGLASMAAAAGATDPATAAAVAAAMMHGMRLPLALTKKQLKAAEMGLLPQNGRATSPANQDEKEGKSKPIHCVIEQASSGRPGTPPSAKSGSAPCDGNIELDTYAILPSNTLFSEIVRVALVKLGYTSAEAIGAKGAIQIRHWKPLTFDTITENPDATVDEILGDLTSIATLRIKLGSRTKSHTVDGVKEKLLQFLLQHSQNMLMSTGCPIDKNFLSAIGKGEYPATMPDDMRRSFERWYRDQTKSSKATSASSPGDSCSSVSSSPEVGKENRYDPAAMFGAHYSPSSAGGNGGHHPYPALRGELNSTHFSRTRIRTSFDPDLEIPRLQRWFEHNQHPSRDQMVFYLHELNALESRRGRKPLDLTNIIYWFKNARAAQRRAHPRIENDRCGSPEVGNEVEPHNTEQDEQTREEQQRLSPAIKQEQQQQDEPENGNRSPQPAASTSGRTGTSGTEEVPVLPNRNAVYVVNEPLHLYKKTEDAENDDSAVLHIEPEDPLDHQRAVTPTRGHTPVNIMDHSKNSPRSSNDSGHASDNDAEHHNHHHQRDSHHDDDANADDDNAVRPQNLSMSGGGIKRSSESLDSDISDDEFNDNDDEDDDSRKAAKALYNGQFHKFYRSHDHINGAGSGSDRNSPSPSGSSGHGMSPLPPAVTHHPTVHHPGAFLPTHPLLTPPTVSTSQGSVQGQPPPAHQGGQQQALQIPHPHHLPHPLNMHLFPHSLYSPLEASALMAAGSAAAAAHHHHHHHQRAFKDSPSPTSGISAAEDHRKKRSRVFIDPLTEIPKLEKWFLEDTHPSSYMIEKYTEEMNRSEYRQRFPKLEPKNVQLWFKNHRAKVKRQRFEHSAGSDILQHSTPTASSASNSQSAEGPNSAH